MKKHSTKILGVWTNLVVVGLVAGCLPQRGTPEKAGSQSDGPSAGTVDDAAKNALNEEVVHCPVEQDGFNFVTSANKWHNKNLSVSFMPDGTVIATTTSQLNALLDAKAPREAWRREYARALAAWAAVTPLNFRIVNDSGATNGIAGPVQADQRFGDIRFGSRSDIGTYAGMTMYPQTAGTAGGDSCLNTTKTTYNVGAPTNIYQLMMHEIGHSIGLMHSSYGTVMYSALTPFTPNNLTTDDINGAVSLYGPRQPDAFDALATNDTLETASEIAIGVTGVTFVSGDLTTTADVDFYKLTVPAGAGPVLAVTALAGQSLLTPALRIYDQTGAVVAQSAAADYGQGAFVQYQGVDAGELLTVAVDSPADDDFGHGAYRLAVGFRADASGSAYVLPASLNPDSMESNESLDQVKSLGQTSSKTVSGLSVHWTWDEDYFSFTTANTTLNTYEVSITPGAGAPAFEIEIYNSAGVKIAQSAGSTLVRFPATRNTLYKVRVHAPTRLPGTYTLKVRRFS